MKEIQRLREAKGWRREDLASRAAITVPTVWDIEAGEEARKTQRRIQLGLAKALKVETAALFGPDGRALEATV